MAPQVHTRHRDELTRATEVVAAERVKLAEAMARLAADEEQVGWSWWPYAPYPPTALLAYHPTHLHPTHLPPHQPTTLNPANILTANPTTLPLIRGGYSRTFGGNPHQAKW